MGQRAISVSDLLSKKFTLIHFEGEWFAAFGHPEMYGIWFVWGHSGNGKTTFLLKLCRELANILKKERILYNSMEEGAAHTMQQAFIKAGLGTIKRRLILVNETIEEMCVRLDEHKSPNIVVIDSWQYTYLTFEKYRKMLKERYPKKLIIINSQAEGSKPLGATARRVMYDATLKIYVEGQRAFSKGRYIGSLGYYTIWDKGAKEYHGN